MYEMRPTKICVLGSTLDRAIWLLDQLCEANQETIYRRRHDVGIMNDGAELVAKSISSSDGLRGCAFDYVFYEEDAMLTYCLGYGDAVEYLEKRCLAHSEIPREFQWCAVSI